MIRKQHREQHKRGFDFTKMALDGMSLAPIKKICLCRVCPSEGLDSHDNLRSALKWVVDGIAEALNCKDDSKLKWDYDQKRGTSKEHGIEVEIIWRKSRA
jgi:hypothetical protein